MKKVDNSLKTYHAKFEYENTDPNRFHIWAKCDNCREKSSIFIIKGTKINQSRLRMIKCLHCGVSGMMHQVEWNGVNYVTI